MPVTSESLHKSCRTKSVKVHPHIWLSVTYLKACIVKDPHSHLWNFNHTHLQLLSFPSMTHFQWCDLQTDPVAHIRSFSPTQTRTSSADPSLPPPRWSDAMEVWPKDLFQLLLPSHLLFFLPLLSVTHWSFLSKCPLNPYHHLHTLLPAAPQPARTQVLALWCFASHAVPQYKMRHRYSASGLIPCRAAMLPCAQFSTSANLLKALPL